MFQDDLSQKTVRKIRSHSTGYFKQMKDLYLGKEQVK